MKIKNIWIPIMVVALIAVIIVSNWLGFNIFPILVFAAGAMIVYGVIDSIINKFAIDTSNSRNDAAEGISGRI